MSKNYKYFYNPLVMSFGINLGGDVAKRQRGSLPLQGERRSRLPGASKDINNFMLI